MNGDDIVDYDINEALGMKKEIDEGSLCMLRDLTGVHG